VQRGATSVLRINMHTERDRKSPYNYLAWEKTGMYMGVATHSRRRGRGGAGPSRWSLAVLDTASRHYGNTEE
jgi:hypothetical protein